MHVCNCSLYLSPCRNRNSTYVALFARAGCLDVDVVAVFRARGVIDGGASADGGGSAVMTRPVKVIRAHLMPVAHVVLEVAALHVL